MISGKMISATSPSTVAGGVYGTMGVPDQNNHPGSRYGHSTVVDPISGVLILFGGYGYDSSQNQGHHFSNAYWCFLVS